jgi:hypothetical protein
MLGYIRGTARKLYSVEEKVSIVPDGLCGEPSNAEPYQHYALCLQAATAGYMTAGGSGASATIAALCST